jgi:hypothetical protein
MFSPHDSLHFCAAAHAPAAPDLPWLQRVLRSSQHLPAPLPPAALANRRIRDSLRLQTSSAWQAALATYPTADNASTWGRRVALGPPPTHPPLHALPRHLLFSVAALALLLCCVVPFLYVLSGRLHYCHSVDWLSLRVGS